MCEATAYVLIDGHEEKLLETVTTAKTENGGVRVMSIFGEEKYVEGRIKEIDITKNRIVIEKSQQKMEVHSGGKAVMSCDN